MMDLQPRSVNVVEERDGAVVVECECGKRLLLTADQRPRTSCNSCGRGYRRYGSGDGVALGEQWMDVGVKMQLQISGDAWDHLQQMAKNNDTTPEAIISAFAEDLGTGSRSGGSDERRIAGDWFLRNKVGPHWMRG